MAKISKSQSIDLPARHVLDDPKDPLSPQGRDGRRIAVRQEREKVILIRFTAEEHGTIRRVAHYYGYSLSQTFRLLAKEKETLLWPNPADRPNVLQIDMVKREKKEEAKKRTQEWKQRKRNAFQKKEMKLRQDAERLQNRKWILEAKEKETRVKLKEMEDIRAGKRTASKSMNVQVETSEFMKREAQKKRVLDVENALVKEMNRLGRKLTESEKWEIGKKIRGTSK